jgi:two-component system OmpR family response regulator
MRVLVVEDDAKIASFVSKGLKQAGLSSIRRLTAKRVLGLSLTEPDDAAVIHIMLPKLDGLSLIQELGRRENNLPVVILSAKRLLTIGSKRFKTAPTII